MSLITEEFKRSFLETQMIPFYPANEKLKLFLENTNYRFMYFDTRKELERFIEENTEINQRIVHFTEDFHYNVYGSSFHSFTEAKQALKVSEVDGVHKFLTSKEVSDPMFASVSFAVTETEVFIGSLEAGAPNAILRCDCVIFPEDRRNSIKPAANPSYITHTS